MCHFLFLFGYQSKGKEDCLIGLVDPSTGVVNQNANRFCVVPVFVTHCGRNLERILTSCQLSLTASSKVTSTSSLSNSNLIIYLGMSILRL